MSSQQEDQYHFIVQRREDLDIYSAIKGDQFIFLTVQRGEDLHVALCLVIKGITSFL